MSDIGQLRNDLYTAVDEAKLTAGTAEFSNSVEKVNPVGVKYALGVGSQSKNLTEEHAVFTQKPSSLFRENPGIRNLFLRSLLNAGLFNVVDYHRPLLYLFPEDESIDYYREYFQLSGSNTSGSISSMFNRNTSTRVSTGSGGTRITVYVDIIKDFYFTHIYISGGVRMVIHYKDGTRSPTLETGSELHAIPQDKINVGVSRIEVHNNKPTVGWSSLRSSVRINRLDFLRID